MSKEAETKNMDSWQNMEANLNDVDRISRDVARETDSYGMMQVCGAVGRLSLVIRDLIREVRTKP